MVETVEMSEIRGLDIDKLVKGFALGEYNFINECTVSSMSGDSVRWYQETAADLTATAPSNLNVSPLSSFPTLEASWTRNTSYVKKYAAEGFLSMEDIKSADIDVLSRTLLRLTRAVMKKRDQDIYAVMDDVTNTFATTAVGGDQWDATSGQDIIKDLLNAKRLIEVQDYSANGATLLLNPYDYQSMVTWLISSKGSSIPNFSSDKVSSGTVMTIVGLNVKVSNNVPEDEALVIVPKVAVTWKSFQDITSRAIEEAGIGTKLRVWTLGVPILTDPYAGCRITDTKT